MRLCVYCRKAPVLSKSGCYCPDCLKLIKAYGKQGKKRFPGYFYTNGKS